MFLYLKVMLIQVFVNNVKHNLAGLAEISVSDLYSFNTDPDPDPIRIQGFDDQKFKNVLS